MGIGEIASAANLDVGTVRSYEKERLLPGPKRGPHGYCVYGASHLEQLAFIRHCRLLGMTLSELRTPLVFRDALHGTCEGANTLPDEHIGHVAARTAELKQLENQLRQLRAQCSQSQCPENCGTLRGMADTDSSRPSLQGL